MAFSVLWHLEKPFFWAARGLDTDRGASLEATQGMDLCTGWLRAALRNSFAFARQCLSEFLYVQG